MVWLAPAIAATAALVQQFVQSRQDKKNVQRQTAANLQLSEDKYQKDVEMMNMVNKYNDPSSQMRRLEGAGLNPNLVYGSGAGQSQSAPGPQYDAIPTQVGVSSPVGLMGALNAYQDISFKQAQIDQMKANARLAEERAAVEPFRKWAAEFAARRSEQDFYQEGKLYPYDLTIKEQEAYQSGLKSQADLERIGVLQKQQKIMTQQEKLLRLDQSYRAMGIAGQELELEKKRADIVFAQFRNEWAKMGVTSSDNPLIRIFTRMFSENGFDPLEWTNEKVEEFKKVFKTENFLGGDLLRGLQGKNVAPKMSDQPAGPSPFPDWIKE